jgi:hypothetical protein
MNRDECRLSVSVRLICNWSRVPAGTTGVIGETLTTEGYRLAVLWDDYYSISLYPKPGERPNLRLSGNASHSDALDDEALERLKVITAEERQRAKDAFCEAHWSRKASKKARNRAAQLALPFTSTQTVRFGNWWEKSQVPNAFHMHSAKGIRQQISV